MDLGISGKTALVAASTGGLGLAVAKALAAEGARVAITGRRRERAEEIAAEGRLCARQRGVLRRDGLAAGRLSPREPGP